MLPKPQCRYTLSSSCNITLNQHMTIFLPLNYRTTTTTTCPTVWNAWNRSQVIYQANLNSLYRCQNKFLPNTLCSLLQCTQQFLQQSCMIVLRHRGSATWQTVLAYTQCFARFQSQTSSGTITMHCGIQYSPPSLTSVTGTYTTYSHPLGTCPSLPTGVEGCWAHYKPFHRQIHSS